LALCSLRVDSLGDHALDRTGGIQFFTDYNFAESRVTPAVRARFPEAPIGATHRT
jgi:hypothetical protein